MRRQSWTVLCASAPLWAIFPLLAGCGTSAGPATSISAPKAFVVGVTSIVGQRAEFGMKQVARNIALERLMRVDAEGSPRPLLAESWSESPDGLTWRIKLRANIAFHDGAPFDADEVRKSLQSGLTQALPPAFDDIAEILAPARTELVIRVKRRSTFVLDSLGEVQLSKAGSPDIGTGPFSMSSADGNTLTMRANKSYYLGHPNLDRIVLKAYPTLRAAWADMLRGQVDMLYEVGQDTIDFMQSSSTVRLYSFQRPYAYDIIFNVRSAFLKSAEVRRLLNVAVDRSALVSQALNDHGSPANGPVWLHHWAYDDKLPAFGFDADAGRRSLESSVHPRQVVRSFTCIFPEGLAPFERLGLTVQRQLQAAGIEMRLEAVPGDRFAARVTSGDFEAALVDAASGPSLIRPYLWWHSGGPYNWGGYQNKMVDDSLDAIRHAPDKNAYRSAVAGFQRAILNDPPALFLAWSERARAITARVDVQFQPNQDVLPTLHLWKPTAADSRAAR